MKPTRSRSRKVLTIGTEHSTAAQQDNASKGRESLRTQLANEEVITRMAEFVSENPNIFEELWRYFKTLEVSYGIMQMHMRVINNLSFLASYLGSWNFDNYFYDKLYLTPL